MTPFDQWYSANILPALLQTLERVPLAARAALEKASRESMTACWNAALDAVNNAGGGVDFTVDEPQLKKHTVLQCVNAVRDSFAAAIEAVRATP